MPHTTAATATSRTATARAIPPSISTRVASSIMAIREGNAAQDSATKNSGSTNPPPGICAKSCGIQMNVSPRLPEAITSSASPTDNTANAVGNTAIPASNEATLWSGRPGSLLTLAPHRSGRAGSAASGSSTDSFATRRRVPAGPGSQAMATAIPKACLASSAIRCRDVETGPNLGVLAVFPSNGATCRCPLPSTGSRGLNSPASAVL